MMPNITSGGRMSGLMTYLAGEGRANEHTEPHLVAGDPAIMALHGDVVLDRAEALAVAHELDELKEFFGVEVTRQATVVDPDTGATRTERVAANVWHCSLSLRAEEGMLTDDQWGRIATDFVDRMGFAGKLSGHADCRWVAVRHGVSTKGNDHVHVAVSLVRADGTKASVHYDKLRSQKVARELEREYGLQLLHEPGRELGERGVKPGERESARRRGAVEVDAHRLERTVRAAAVCSADEGEFLRRLRQAGVLVRPRFAAGRADVVAGYSVALRPERAPAGTQEPVIWHGGGRLARDLTLPELRKGWPDRPESALEAVKEWRATASNPWRYTPVNPGREVREPAPEVWTRYSAELASLREQLWQVPVSDRATWAKVARETSGAMAAWSQRVEVIPGPLAEASRTLARSAHLRTTESSARPAGWVTSAGSAMVLLHVSTAGNPTLAQAVLLRELVKLSRALHDMHKAAGDARRAQEVRVMMTEKLKTVTDRMPAITATAAMPEGSTVPTQTLSPELHLVRERMETNQGWAEGSPVPPSLAKVVPDPLNGASPAGPTRRREDDRGR